MNDNIENDELDNFIEEIEENQRKTFNDTFDFLKDMGVTYLNRENNTSGICLVYETFIYFLINEEYEKCAFLKKILNEYRDYSLLKSTNLMKMTLNELDKL
jgi:hypothetical protein